MRGGDGFVSLEVSPHLAHDTSGTVDEAQRLWRTVDRPNLMIKVPATAEGVPAVERLIAQGVNVNSTLIFSLDHYEAVAHAYLRGLDACGDPAGVASVASFFVSRVDTAVDRELEEIGENELLGKIAIAHAKAAYALFRETFSGERWERLAALGARVQRPLWASTSTKNPLYPDTLYVDGLIRAHTVNTLPPATLEAFRDHGRVRRSLEEGMAGADVVYAKSWGCMLTTDDMEASAEISKKYTDWIADERRMEMADEDAIYMHPLPADRNIEVSDGVIDGPQSVVFDQAENRLHAQKAVMALTM